MTGHEPVDHASRQTEKLRQGTGPRSTVKVLMISIGAAAIIGAGLLLYFGGRFF
jgi:hypothetical protein